MQRNDHPRWLEMVERQWAKRRAKKRKAMAHKESQRHIRQRGEHAIQENQKNESMDVR